MNITYVMKLMEEHLGVFAKFLPAANDTLREPIRYVIHFETIEKVTCCLILELFYKLVTNPLFLGTISIHQSINYCLLYIDAFLKRFYILK